MIAMTHNDAPKMDLEALQAQINLSMSLTEELVSSWIRPTTKSSLRPVGSTGNPEKELQEYLRRPARLGVGAPTPESYAVVEREESKLRHKILPKDKKRRRDEESDLRKQGEEEEGDMIERKGDSRAISKRVRPDPFAVPARQKKKTMPVTPASEEFHPDVEGNGTLKSHNAISVNGASKDSAAQNGMRTERVPEEEYPKRSEDIVSESSSSQISKKRKKKRKNASLSSQLDAAALPTALESQRKVDSFEDEDQEWTGFGASHTMEESAPPNTLRDTVSSNLQEKASTPSVTAPSSLSPRTPVALPLLNLHGPPPDTEDSASNSVGASLMSKKRRKRNRRKKYHKSDE